MVVRIILRTEAFLIEQRWSSRGSPAVVSVSTWMCSPLQFGADGLFGGHQLDGDGDLLVGAGAEVDDGDLFVQDDNEGLWWCPDSLDRCLSQGFPVDDQFLAQAPTSGGPGR